MGHEAIYKCNKCGKTFTACEGGGQYFDEYRCVQCDGIKQVMLHDLKNEELTSPSNEEVGVCLFCNGEVRNDIKPMCRKCKSRDVTVEKILMKYD